MRLDDDRSYSHTTIRDQIIYLAEDLEDEVKRETRAVPDSSLSDMLVQRHVTGLAVSFFILIALFLLLAMGAIAFYGYRWLGSRSTGGSVGIAQTSSYGNDAY